MLGLDIEGKEFNIGDTVILRDEFRCYKALLIKETKLSVGYKVLETTEIHLDKKWTFWIRKSSKNI